MANSRSARKRIRSNETKHLRNKGVRSAVRTKVGQARRALLGAEPGAAEPAVRAAVSALDRAAEKGILHRNNAARRKSRLTALAARLARAGGEEQAVVRAAAAGGEKGRSATRTARAVKGGRSGGGSRAPATRRPSRGGRTA